jgi:hypothetical protein
MPCLLFNEKPTFKLFKSLTEDPNDFKDLREKFKSMHNEYKILRDSYFKTGICSQSEKFTEDFTNLCREYDYYGGCERVKYLNDLIKETIKELKEKHRVIEISLCISVIETNEILINHNRPYIPFEKNGKVNSYDDKYINKKLKIDISYI